MLPFCSSKDHFGNVDDLPADDWEFAVYYNNIIILIVLLVSYFIQMDEKTTYAYMLPERPIFS